MSSALQLISNIVGWMYVITWGSYSYPQIFHTFKLRNFEGMKVDYPFLNLSGFIFYAIAYSVPYFHPLPLKNYGFGTVPWFYVFAYNGTFVSIVLNLQALFYERGKNKLSTFSIVLTILCWLASIAFYLASEVYHWIAITENVNILEFLGYLKISFSLIRYIPLLYWNYKRKSTGGLSVVSFFLNMTGASLSLLQLFIDYIDGTTQTINKVKLGLAVVVIIYDFIFLFQYYVLYGRRDKKLEQNQSLLGSKFSQGIEDQEDHYKN